MILKILFQILKKVIAGRPAHNNGFFCHTIPTTAFKKSGNDMVAPFREGIYRQRSVLNDIST